MSEYETVSDIIASRDALRADLSAERAECERLRAENAALLRGEFICRSCGLRKNAESSGSVEF